MQKTFFSEGRQNASRPGRCRKLSGMRVFMTRGPCDDKCALWAPSKVTGPVPGCGATLHVIKGVKLVSTQSIGIVLHRQLMKEKTVESTVGAWGLRASLMAFKWESSGFVGAGQVVINPDKLSANQMNVVVI